MKKETKTEFLETQTKQFIRRKRLKDYRLSIYFLTNKDKNIQDNTINNYCNYIGIRLYSILDR